MARRPIVLSGTITSCDDRNLVLTFELHGLLTNLWGSPHGLALQPLDAYTDQDPGDSAGARMLLPGRNAALAEGFRWEAAVWAEGWAPQFVIPESNGVPNPEGSVALRVITEPGNRRITLHVPRRVSGDGDLRAWACCAILLRQDGFPSPGVWRVRDVLEEAQQWRLGGAGEEGGYARIIDVIWGDGEIPTQKSMLPGSLPGAGPRDELPPQAFPQLRMLRPGDTGG